MITLLIDLSDGDSEPETEPESGLWDDSDKSFMEWYNYRTIKSFVLNCRILQGYITVMFTKISMIKYLIQEQEMRNFLEIVLRCQDFFWLLKIFQWLNDQVNQSKVSAPCLLFVLQVINFYLKLLTKTFNDTYVYSTVFYPKILRLCLQCSTEVDPWKRYIGVWCSESYRTFHCFTFV